MSDVDHAALQAWYRTAMLARMDELLELRERLLEREEEAAAGLRAVGHALRGSGTSFGFPEATDAGALLEDAPPEALLRRTDGALSTLSRIVGEDAPQGPHAWLSLATGLPGAETTDELGEAWARVAAAVEGDAASVAQAVAEAYGLTVAELDDEPSRAAVRLVPAEAAVRLGILPLREDGERIVVACADPVSPLVETELRQITGRRPRVAVAEPTDLERRVAETFPEARPSGGKRRSPLPGPSDHPRILVLEDDSVARLILTSTLERKGYRVLAGKDGVEGLELLGDNPDTALAVVDLEMPRMGGQELLEHLREDPRWRELPVMVVTGAQDAEVEADLIEAGADDYIRKPVEPRLFLARVAATLRRAAG